MRKIIFLLSTLLLPFESSLAQAQLPDGLSEDCRSFIAGLPKEIDYGFVQVPENWAHPKGSPQFSVFYYGTNLNEIVNSGITPMVYFNGGPGYSTHSASIYFRTFAPAQGIPFLYIDQRGTGCSGEYPTVAPTLEGARRLALYGTLSIVRDAEAVRKALFPDRRKWSLFGQSFGTAIIHRYIVTAPDAIQKAFAHGLSMMTDSVGWVSDRMLAQKRVAGFYLALYPEDEQILIRARTLFPSDYCSGNQMFKACGPALLDNILFSLGFSVAWVKVHGLVGKIFNSNGTLNFTFIEQLIPRGISEDKGMRDFMAASVSTRELPGGLLEAWSCKLAMPRLIASGEHPNTWFLSECRLSLATESPSDSFIEKLIAEDYLTLSSLARSLRRFPSLELHLYSGELDTFSPREGCKEVVETLGKRIFYTNFLKTGHDWSNEPQIWDDLKK